MAACEDCKGINLCYVHWCITNWKLGIFGKDALTMMQQDSIIPMPKFVFSKKKKVVKKRGVTILMKNKKKEQFLEYRL